MAKPSHRERILTVGMQVVHQHGFGGASVRDIVQAAGVPQGSFTNHFTSKEAFGLEVIDRHFSEARAVIEKTLRNDTLPPMQRLRDYIDVCDELNRNSLNNGCLFGNFAAEASECSVRIRLRLVEIFAEMQGALAHCLRAAVKAGEVSASLDCDATAGYIVSSRQGAILLAKTLRSSVPLERFKELLFSRILRGTDSAEPVARAKRAKAASR